MAGEDRPIQRKGDANSSGGTITTTDGNSTVYANNLLVAVDGSKGTGHGQGVHATGNWATTGGSSNVFAHGVPINFTDNIDTCGHVRIGGSNNVFVGETVDQANLSNQTMISLDEEDTVNPGNASVLVAAAAASGAVSAAELAAANNPKVSQSDNTKPANTAVVLSTDCSDIASIDPFPTGNAIDNIVLTTNYTVGKLTRSPSVTFEHLLRAGTAGLSLEQIICNLKLLAINIIEPTKSQYSNMFITNTWRPAGVGSSTSQHPKGQAVDMQFRGVAKKDYFTIAQWCRDNLVYDQLLLEYKTTGSGLPWIHMSFNKDGNKKQILTLLNNSTYSTGLVDLSGT